MARFSYSKAYGPYGASMGRREDPIATFNTAKPLALQRVPACDGGDYDPGGAYWGDLRGNPLWRVEDCLCSQRFYRAPTREAAKEKIRKDFSALPNVRFFK